MYKYASLIPEVSNILLNKNTEPAFSGNHLAPEGKGTYLCRGCGLALYRGDAQFLSQCGWPSFDEEITNAVTQLPDADGLRTEIVCHRCQGHLGHLFHGEHYTANNVRHCVNSLAIDFVHDMQVLDTEEAIMAGGCFWGVEHYLQKINGVVLTRVGYIGGHTITPCYQEVCCGNSGHFEAVRVVFDTAKTNYATVIKTFFETHDPTQNNGQGNDVGSQYRSAIFTFNNSQQDISHGLIAQLEQQGLQIVTKVLPMYLFWQAEVDHQNYYNNNRGQPYCHRYTKRFY